MTILDPTNLCQIEIAVSHMEAAISFYKNVFGWNVSNAKMHNFTILDVPEKCKFGISLVPKVQESTISTGVTLYFNSDQCAQLKSLALKHGGKVSTRAVVPGHQLITYIEDLDGNNFGLIQYNKDLNLNNPS